MTKRPHPARRKAIADALAGTIASLFALWMFYPVDVYKTKIQASRKQQQQQQNGLRRADSSASQLVQEYFAGWRVKTVHTISSSFCYFYLYSLIVSLWTSRHSKRSSSSPSNSNIAVPTRLMLSALSAMMNTCLTLPLDVLATGHQVSGGGNAQKEVEQQKDVDEEFFDSDMEEQEEHYQMETSNKRWKHQPIRNGSSGMNGSDRMRTEEKAQKLLKRTSLSFIIEDYGPWWKGLVPSLLLCTNPSIHYTVFDAIKAQVLKRRSTPTLRMTEAFLLGLFAKFVATVATYPLIRAKVMLMVTTTKSTTTRTTPSSSTRRSPIAQLVQHLVDEYRHHGVAGLYRGCRLQLFHTLLKSALLMMVRERIARTTHSILLPTTPAAVATSQTPASSS